MANAKFKLGDIEINVAGDAETLRRESEAFYGLVGRAMSGNIIAQEKANTTEVVVNVPQKEPGIKEDVVAIYDDAGIPSIMRRFTKVTNKDLFGGSEKVHPAFIVGDKEYDEIFISVYENCEIGGKPYSLPHTKPWTSITNDDAAKACFSKGVGWHLMTAAEWGLVANLCLKNGTMPHGNTSSGSYHGDKNEKGVLVPGSSCITLTGSGPATWTHNHQSDGLHDLCGNVWEMARGFRMKDGKPQHIKNNNAALDIDLSESSENWEDFRTADGDEIYVDARNGVRFTDDIDEAGGYNGTRWSAVEMDIDIPEEMKELAIYNGEENAYCYLDASEGEYFAYRGGSWYGGSGAGVFDLYGYYGRSSTYASVGFRSAYYR